MKAAVLEWLRGISEPEIAIDYNGDWYLLCGLLGSDVPDGLTITNVYPSLDKQALEDYHIQNDVLKHHALHDARANRHAASACSPSITLRRKEMASFVVHGPFDLEYTKQKGGRVLEFDSFWRSGFDASFLAQKRGCYVFAMKNRGLTPIYVGKATKTFKQETFNPTNKHKYQKGFSQYEKGRPVMYFVVHPDQRGQPNGSQISEIEDFLIQAGVAKNPDIQNVKGAQQPKWTIKGVMRSGVGKRSAAEAEFRKLFDIR